MVGNKIGILHHNFVHEYNQFVADVNKALRAYYATTVRTDDQTVKEMHNHHQSIMFHADALIAKAERVGLIRFTNPAEAKPNDVRSAVYALRIVEN